MKKEEKMLLYNPENEPVKVDVVLKDEEIWLTQKAMAELFETTVANIKGIWLVKVMYMY